jgi:hypothetical protein
MDRANISDRASIARLYPFAAFLGEANANVRARASIWRGVEIIAGPDAEGWFAMTRASRHAGERDVAGGARFLCPFAQATGHAPDDPAPAAGGGGGDGRTGAYDAFIDKIIDVARAMPPEPAPGAGDIRLRGLRQ